MEMIDVMTERLLPLIAVPSAVPTRPGRSTARRWAREGIDGVVLETVKVGGRRYTSYEAVARFLERLNGRLGCVTEMDSAMSPGTPTLVVR
jgi:hypothetical protein